MREDSRTSFRLLTGYRDRNWLEFLAILDATFSAEGDTANYVEATRNFFTEIAERDGQKDRSGPLALLELEKRARERSVSKGISKTRFDPLSVLIISLKTLRPWGNASSRTSISLVTKLAALRI